ncbi:ornithine cyclodeaminase family protein [Longispora albida]|uniref:ornithine cyclodeaminase family protein n=1 Tax=Longispora albida TaxID=203523 RepID=UPI00038057CF|nr:ornithine cyclodeaminase family protein [Longispora albida]
MTLVFSRSAVEAALDAGEALGLLAEGFRVAGSDGQRHRGELPGPGTAMCLMPGLLPGIPAYTVKVNAKFPGSTPALRGVVCLFDLATGELLALLDSASVTAWRTGLAAALAIRVLGPERPETIGFVGAGAQNAMVHRGLAHAGTQEKVVVWDLDPAKAAAFAAGAEVADPLPVADVVVCATWAREPIVRERRPGQFLVSLGADEPGKIEIGLDVLASSRVIVDDLALGVPGAAGTLGQVLRGEIPARADVYLPVGLPWQDLALAWTVYQTRAGTPIDLLS